MESDTAITQDELAGYLKGCPSWSLVGSEIRRTFEFKTFPCAIDFVQSVAGVAEEEGHHPDISVHYNKVTLALTTHSRGSLTAADFEVARRLDQLAP